MQRFGFPLATVVGQKANFAKSAICALVPLELTEADFRFVPFSSYDNAHDRMQGDFCWLTQIHTVIFAERYHQVYHSTPFEFCTQKLSRCLPILRLSPVQDLTSTIDLPTLDQLTWAFLGTFQLS